MMGLLLLLSSSQSLTTLLIASHNGLWTVQPLIATIKEKKNNRKIRTVTIDQCLFNQTLEGGWELLQFHEPPIVDVHNPPDPHSSQLFVCPVPLILSVSLFPLSVNEHYTCLWKCTPCNFLSFPSSRAGCQRQAQGVGLHRAARACQQKVMEESCSDICVCTPTENVF
ncbi:hypothetical protein INR49_029726 [Caranx melampygus]|nr:hypothetical protein INR49_029726 [Caranx melampygus]